MTFTYDWPAALAFFATLTVATIALRKAIFSVPVFQEMRQANRAVDKTKLSRDVFRNWVKTNSKAGLYYNLAFYVVVLPFFVSFDARPLWQHALEVVAILAVFDFMYYWTHRSLFHGTLLRKVHALHHQARKPTHIDSQYVHPIETIIGLSLFLFSIPIVSLIEGAPLNIFSSVVATLVFTQLNTLNHTWTRLPHDNRLYRVVDYITGVHHAHHIDMNHGNFATLTMFYDKLFGTFEEPANREAA